MVRRKGSSGRFLDRPLIDDMGGDTMRRQSLSNLLATWIIVILLIIVVASTVFNVDLAALVGLARTTPVAPVFGGIVPTRPLQGTSGQASTVYTVSTAVAPTLPQAQPVQPRVEYIMVTVPPVEQTSEPVVIVVTTTPEPATATPLPTDTAVPTATLPALPAYSPYTKAEYDACFEIYNAGRLAELPDVQEHICLGYVGAGD
jgi:hypothetical protein